MPEYIGSLTAEASIPSAPAASGRLRGTDYLLLSALCSILFGYACIGGAPITMHEARLPETSREMMLRHDYLTPMNGDRPWLERPPLPHWIMIISAKLMGQHCDNEWSVRIPPALMGLLIVLMTANIATIFFGRATGLLSGLLLATIYEFYRYATLAEDDIFLAAVVVATFLLFIQQEFLIDPDVKDAKIKPFDSRPWRVILLFVLLGLTNLAKGPLVGAAVIVATIVPLLIWERNDRRIRRYVWGWGILGSVILAASWHLIMMVKFHDYLANLKFDFTQSKEFDNPWWYYPEQLFGAGLPWTPIGLVGLILAVRPALKERSSIHRFLVCWAIMPILVLSIPHRKHHHYLVPSLAPWAILAAGVLPMIGRRLVALPEWSRRPRFGLIAIGLPGALAVLVLISQKKFPGPTLVAIAIIAVWLICVAIYYQGALRQKPAWMLAAILLGEAVAACWGQTFLPNDTVADTQFLRNVNATVPADKLLAIDGGVGPLDFFRIQFYLRGDAILLHNLSYLRSDQFDSPDIYVVAREYDQPPLSTLGVAIIQLESTHTRRQTNPSQRLALFHLTFHPGLTRYPPPPIGVMQAMERKPGPFCGPELPEPQAPPQ